MIAVEQMAAGKSPLALSAVSFALGAGVHAVLGAPADGASLLLEVLAGRARVRAGRVRVLERDADDAEARRAVAYVPREPLLPDALTVAEVLRVAAEIRGEAPPDVDARLAPFGIASLASRKVRSLTREEARAVALAEALGSTATRVVLVDEPFVAIDPRAAAGVRDALRARAHDGTCVLVATASPRDAASIATSVRVLWRGRLVADDASPHASSVLATGSAELRIVARDARALVAALAVDTAITSVETRDAAVLVRGPDELALAAAVARAAIAASVDIQEMRAEAAPLEQLQAAATGAAMAAYDAGYARARAAAAQPTSPSPRWRPSS